LTQIKGHKKEILYLSNLLKKDELPQALLFTGQGGIGKATVAELFAMMILCQSQNRPCNTCPTCLQISRRSYPDFLFLQRDEKGKIPIGSEEETGSVRWLIDKLSRKAIHGRYMAIVDGVDSISENGQNALLKTIEEPSLSTVLILIADNKSGILPTIISRCMELPFKPLTEQDVEDIIKEKHPERRDSEILAKISGGSPGNALKLCEGDTLSSILEIAKEISNYVNKKSTGLQNIAFPSGSDADFFITILINIYSFILTSSIKGEPIALPAEILTENQSAAKVIKILLALKKGLKNNLNPKNFLKGAIYSLSHINTTGFLEPDFSWINR
jgi:DNA polymerase III delta prime subunit